MPAPDRPVTETTRPSETAGVAGALGLLIARLFGVQDPDTIVAIGVAVGFVPAAVTYLIEARRRLRG